MNRRASFLFRVILFCLLSTGGAWATPSQADLEKSIRPLLSNDWKFNRDGESYIITYKPEVTFYNNVSTYAGEDVEKTRVPHGHEGLFSMKLIIGPRLRQEAYDDLRKAIPQQRPNKEGYEVQEYYLETSSALPRAFGSDYSVYLATTRNPFDDVWPPSAAKECRKTYLAIMNLFDEYK